MTRNIGEYQNPAQVFMHCFFNCRKSQDWHLESLVDHFHPCAETILPHLNPIQDWVCLSPTCCGVYTYHYGVICRNTNDNRDNNLRIQVISNKSRVLQKQKVSNSNSSHEVHIKRIAVYCSWKSLVKSLAEHKAAIFIFLHESVHAQLIHFWQDRYKYADYWIRNEMQSSTGCMAVLRQWSYIAVTADEYETQLCRWYVPPPKFKKSFTISTTL